MKFAKCLPCFILTCWLFTAQVFSGNKPICQEAGLPYIQNFSPKDYNGGIQNFSMVQDAHGIIYVGNSSGVLIYDGISWRVVKVPNQSAVRSLCVVKNRVYLGAVGDLGYLEPDATGRLRYTSLRADLPKEYRDFKDVYRTTAMGDAVYFSTHDTIFRWMAGRVRAWKSSNQIHQLFASQGRLYVVEDRVGLMEMVGDTLHLLPGGQTLATQKTRTIVPFDSSGILLGTFAHGLFLYDGSAIKAFPTAIDAFLRQNQLRHAAMLPGGLIALATVRGVVIIDRAGNLCQTVNKAAGLRDEYVVSLFVDHQNGLWLGLNNGIARVETPASISRFQARLGVESYVESIVRHQGVLYIATDRGVRYLDTTTASFPAFRPVEGFSTISWSFLSAGAELLVGTQEGIFAITGTKATRLNKLAAVILYRPKQDSSFIFVGSLDGLAVMRRHNNRWTTLGMVRGIPERVYTLAEDKNGVLWAGTPSQSILKIAPDFPHLRERPLLMHVTRFGKEHGLPAGQVSPAGVGNKLFFLTSRGLRQFAANQERFPPDSTFGAVFADTLTRITQLREDARGNVWIVATRGDETYNGRAVRQPDGSYQWQDTPFLRMHDLGDVYFTYPEEDGTVWFGGVEGLARYRPDIAKNYQQDYPTLIRRVRAIAADSTFYHGASGAKSPQPEIAYQDNSLRFEFAGASYDDASANRYQVKLEGFDRDWSYWTHETKKDYTGLPAGDYTFRVRAKNIYGHLSTEGTFSFAILPPWYQTWWATLFYMVMAAGLMALIVKGRVRYLEKKTKELETIVSDRTAQIVEQKSKIEEQALRLQELDRMKSRFFANISHEFRTPLTLILGPLEKRVANAKKEVDKQEFGMMRRNAARLLQLINQLLDLSRLEAGKMKLNAGRGDLIALLRGIVMSFASLAEQKKIALQFEPCEGFEVYFDPDKIEKIFTNLLSNALKFTPEGGRISVVVSIPKILLNPPSKGDLKDTPLSPPSRGELKGGVIAITIKDTGIGIAADRLVHIFDRFYQVDDTSTREHAGTGVGLALTKELVELHHGSIEVESEEGRGATFTVRLPLGKEHLSPEEIVDTPHSPPSRGDLKGSVPAGLDQLKESIQEAEFLTSAVKSPSAKGAADQNATIILIVDDHPDVRGYVRTQLETKYQIIEAKDGEQGLKFATEIVPDLVISDVMMPKMSGYQLCERLKQNEKTSHVPVILLTAKADEADKLAGLETGADDYLSKPFNSKELQARVHNLIESRRKLRQRFHREGLLQPRKADVTSIEEAFIQKLMTVIEDNLAEETFHPEALSNNLHMSLRQLQRKTRALTGQTPSDFIRTVRLQRAKQMLEQHTGSVSEIAFQVGFNDLSYFSRCFRREFGVLPSEVGR